MNEWIRCRPWIEAALEYANGTHTIEDIEDGIAAGRYQFWAGKRAAIITEVIEYPQRKTILFFLIGGDLTELQEMEPRIVEWARTELGCKESAGVGRRGFERAFSGHGYTQRWTCITKELA